MRGPIEPGPSRDVTLRTSRRWGALFSRGEGTANPGVAGYGFIFEVNIQMFSNQRRLDLILMMESGILKRITCLVLINAPLLVRKIEE